MSEFPPLPGSTASDIDLYCLECGYNLRGLSGDPRRCPECGHLNPMGDLELPAAEISAQLRMMETRPVLCVAACLVGLVILLPLLAIMPSLLRGRPLLGARADILAGLACFGLPILACACAWIEGAAHFRKSCRARPGWGGALLTYHCYALGLSLLIVMLIVGVTTVHEEIVVRRGWEVVGTLALVVLFAGSLVLIGLLTVRAHRRLKEVMEPLQRDVAVEIARDRLRRRLYRPRMW